MSQIKTYPEMNETIKDLLLRSEEPMQLYILTRIEELEKQVSDLIPPPNDPLTLEELREMDGEPVFLETGMVDIREQIIAEWDILVEHDEDCFFFTRKARGFLSKNYGKTWLACRRRPEEGDEHGTVQV